MYVQLNSEELQKFAVHSSEKKIRRDDASRARWLRRKALSKLQGLSHWTLDRVGLTREELPAHLDRLLARELRDQELRPAASFCSRHPFRRERSAT